MDRRTIHRIAILILAVAGLSTAAVIALVVTLGGSADHRLLLPVAGLTGGVFLMVADTAARTLISPSEIPVGVITALVGGPVFLYLLVNRRARVVI